MSTIAERVAAAAMALDADRGRGKWEPLVNLETLDIATFMQCVEGQVYGGCWKAPLPMQHMSGFLANDQPDADALCEEWRRLIRKRTGPRRMTGEHPPSAEAGRPTHWHCFEHRAPWWCPGRLWRDDMEQPRCGDYGNRARECDDSICATPTEAGR